MTDRKIPAAFLAVMVHLIFLAVLVFGFRWQASEPALLQAEIWHDLPPVEARPAEEPQPKPRPEPAPETKAEKPDPEIALKKAREEKMQQERLQEEKLRKQKDLEKRKEFEKQVEKQKELKERRLEKLREEKAREQADALNRAMQQKTADARARLVDQYKSRIMTRVKRYVVVPPDMKGNPEAQFDVVLLPDGEVLKVTLRKSSGYAAYDAAVERAILRASPLPLPPDASLFDEFRNLDLHFKPDE